jgi:tRNA (mo5U34)-methyltransferase
MDLGSPDRAPGGGAMRAARAPAELHDLSRRIPWWHSIHLGEGFVTRGSKSVSIAEEMARWKFPADLTGQSVLDIGCNDGGYAIAALERGASRVLAIDEMLTDGMRFLLEHRLFAFEFRRMDLLSDEFLRLPVFDFVIFAGVLYHLQNPVEGLRRVRRVTGRLALVETHIDERVTALPAMVYYEGAELNDDPTNWWGPNRLCVEAMLRTVGFSTVELAHVELDPGTAMGRAAYLASVTERRPPRTP